MRPAPGLGLAALATAAAGVAAAAYGLLEAVAVDVRRREVATPGLPADLDGLTVLHLSDTHLGAISLNAVSLARATAAGAAHRPELVVWTGDLTHGRAPSPAARSLFASVRGAVGTFGVRGNHDEGDSRDPLSGGEVIAADAFPFELLDDASRTVTVRGLPVEIAGLLPRTDGRAGLDRIRAAGRSGAAARLLLLHYPEAADACHPGEWTAAFAGHVHGGQIVLPNPLGGDDLRCSCLGHPNAAGGVFRPAAAGGMPLLVSRGVGTTFVPFRVRCRPEAPVWVLRSA